MWRFLLLLLAGCAANERGECLDWDVRETRREKCIPLYGELLCADEITHTYTCVLREDDGNA